MTKYGIYDAKMIDCKNDIVCTFAIEIVEDMMPQFTVEAYLVKGIDSIANGFVKIMTANLGPNHVSQSLSNTIFMPNMLYLFSSQ